MKTIQNVIESAAQVVKESSKARREFNVKYYSLSRLLKDAQAKSARKYAEPLFNKLGLEWSNDKDLMLKPADVFSMLTDEQWETNKKGERFPVIWTRTQAKDEDGNKLWEDDEETVPVMTDKATRITEGGWTMNKLFKLIAQANAFKA